MTAARAPRPRWLPVFEAGCLAAFAGLGGVALVRACLAEPSVGWSLGRVGAVALALGLGVLAADFATGLVHWFGDRCGAPHTPLIGPTLIQPFREHHTDPAAITHHGSLEVMGNNALALLPILAWAALRASDFAGSALARFEVTFLLAFAALGLASNAIHRWAHMEEVARPVAWLQAHGWILSPTRHALHHQGEHDRGYCVATGWMNPLLDQLGLFRALDRLVRGSRTGWPRRREAGVGRLS